MEKINKFFYLVINLMLYGAAQLIPKSKEIWVFGSWFGKKFNDNPKALYEYVNAHDDSIKVVWITKEKSLVELLRNKKYLAFYYLSIKGIYYQLRAGFSFVSTSVHDDLFAPCIGSQTKNIQLWHGIPLKKIMFDAYSTDKKDQNFNGKLFNLLTPYDKHRNDYLISTSELTQKIMAGAFRVPIENTIITGFPRNDVFVTEKLINDETVLYKCIYMPTHRGGMGGDFNLFEKYGFDIESIDQILIDNGIELTLRLHAFNSPSEELMADIAKSKMLRMDLTPDIYESINTYDCLITDYSSIYFDFLLSDKPIIFSAFDIEIYKKNERELYFDFGDVTLEPNCFNWSEVVKRVVDIKNNGMDETYKQSYKQLKDRFHDKKTSNNLSFSKVLLDKLYSLK